MEMSVIKTLKMLIYEWTVENMQDLSGLFCRDERRFQSSFVF